MVYLTLGALVLFIMSSHLGSQLGVAGHVYVVGFLCYLQGELKHWAHRIKETDTQDVENVDIHLFTLLSEDLNTNWVTKGIK